MENKRVLEIVLACMESVSAGSSDFKTTAPIFKGKDITFNDLMEAIEKLETRELSIQQNVRCYQSLVPVSEFRDITAPDCGFIEKVKEIYCHHHFHEAWLDECAGTGIKCSEISKYKGEQLAYLEVCYHIDEGVKLGQANYGGDIVPVDAITVITLIGLIG